ncbi:MAG TPA: AAA family ATPase [Coriobacteriia bacterium]
MTGAEELLLGTKREPDLAPTIGILLSDVVPERVTWLWDGRIPLGKLTILDGDPGLGKSTLSLAIAAHVSRGLPLPHSTEPSEAAGVVLLSAEDDLADTIRPRLDAAGANVHRIVALRTFPGDDDIPPSIPADLHLLEQAIDRVGARLVVIDPLMAFLDAEVDGHKDQSVRRALHRLSKLAEDTGTAVVVIRHLNKATGGNPLYRGGGSIGIIGAARAGMLVARDPDDATSRVLATTKCNLAAEAESLSFHLEQHDEASRVVWDGVSTHGAGMLLAESDGDPTALDEAKEVVADILAAGPVASPELRRRALGEGVSERTMRRARSALCCVRRKTGFTSGWTWELPNTAEPGQPPTLGHVATFEESWPPSGAETIPFDTPDF